MNTASLSSPSSPVFTTYRVAAIQYEPIFAEKEQNVRHLLRLVEEAARHDARLIVLPEMATTGYCWESREEVAPMVEPIPGPTTQRFQELATRFGCYITVSLPEVDPLTNVYYNSAVLLGPDGLIGVYRKVHAYLSEPRWARDGDLGFPVWETPLGRLSCLICMDANYFEAARVPALHGADVLLFPTNWLEEKSPSIWWMARAFENGVYFIAANRYGRERGVQFSGGSCILNPDGTIQAYIDNGEGIVYGEVDLSKSREKQWNHPHEPMGDRLADRRPEEYVTLLQNTYLWEPLRYHGLYGLGELPPGQLSCVGILQTDLQEALPDFAPDRVRSLHTLIETLMRDHAPARPDILVLPELMLPGPLPQQESFATRQPFQPLTAERLAAHFRDNALRIPGPETEALVALADSLQISLVIGVAERDQGAYYNTVLLIDPEGIYGHYRKLHLTNAERLWAQPGNRGLPVFDTPTGRVGLATGYDILFPETLRVLAGKGADLVCAPTLLNFPDAIGLPPTTVHHLMSVAPDEYDPMHYVIWRLRSSENNVYLALANWGGQAQGIRANGLSGLYAPLNTTYPWNEVIADEGEPMLMMMTIDTREQRTGRRTTHHLGYSPGDMAGSLTGELAYDIRDSIPGNAVRAKPQLRKRQPFWYLDLVRPNLAR